MPRCTAAAGTTVAPRFTSTISLMLTNWLGNRLWSSFGNCAFSFTVPVAGSIWLSAVSSIPLASCVLPPRSKAFAASFSPARSFFITGGRLSSGMLNTTVIGCSCVITTRPLASPARTMLPRSTWRRPTRPATGAVMRQ